MTISPPFFLGIEKRDADADADADMVPIHMLVDLFTAA